MKPHKVLPLTLLLSFCLGLAYHASTMQWEVSRSGSFWCPAVRRD